MIYSAKAPEDDLGQAYPLMYERPYQSSAPLRRNIPAMMNTTRKEDEKEYMDLVARTDENKSKEARMLDLVHGFQMRNKPYPNPDQFSLQASTNAFHRAKPSDLLAGDRSDRYQDYSTKYGPFIGVSERAYMPSKNYARNYENLDNLLRTSVGNPPPPPDYPVYRAVDQRLI
jgi:hypothetical protein